MNSSYSGVSWGEAPTIRSFLGRSHEIKTLKEWVLFEKKKLVCIYGMGGIGKTSLATQLAHEITSSFDFVFWYSLKNAPPVKVALKDTISFFSRFQLLTDEDDVDKLISKLIDLLRHNRCLLIFDNFDSVYNLKRFGAFETEFNSYSDVLNNLGVLSHKSTVLITSREKPIEIGLMEGEDSPICSLELSGLSTDAGKSLLLKKSVSGESADWKTLNELYSGNPLALTIVAETIRELYGGQVKKFLKHGTIVFGQIQGLLEDQLNRLGKVEQSILYWLAINGEPINASEIMDDLIRPISDQEYFTSLQNLKRKALLEQVDDKFALQNVVMEYLVEKILSISSTEIIDNKPDLICSHSLIKLNSKDYVRQGQIRLIVKRLIEKLTQYYGSRDKTKKQLDRLLIGSREKASHSYVSGNIINLLVNMGENLSEYDLSDLNIRQADFRGITLHGTDFSKSNVSGSEFTNVFGNVTSVVFNPSGTYMAASTADGDVYIWETNTFTLSQVIRAAHDDWIIQIKYHPSGKLLATCSRDSTIKLWNTETCEPLQVFRGHSNWVNSIAFNRKGDLLISGSEDRTIRVWDISNGDCTKTITQADTSRVRTVEFTPAETRICSGGGDGTIKFWDIETCQLAQQLIGHTALVHCISFHPNGRILATSSEDQRIRLWDYESGICTKILEGHVDAVWPIVFTASGNRLVSGGGDRILRIWDVETGETLMALPGHNNWIWSVSIHPDNQLLASGGSDQIVKLWDIESGRCIKTIQGFTQRIWSVNFSPDDSRILASSGGADWTAKIWDTSSGKNLHSFHGHANIVWSVTHSPNGKLLVSGGDDRAVMIWDVESGQNLASFFGHTHRIKSVLFSKDGNLVWSGSEDQTIRLWDIEKRVCTKKLYEPGHRVWAIALEPDENFLVSAGADQTIRIWDLESGKIIRTIQNTHRIWTITLLPSTLDIVTGGGDKKVKIWDFKTGKQLDETVELKDWVWSVRRHPTRPIIASASGNNIQLWSENNLKLEGELEGHLNRIRSLSFSHTGALLASSSDDETIKIWDIKNNDCLRSINFPRPYQDMKISGILGVTQSQKMSLKLLGANDSLSSFNKPEPLPTDKRKAQLIKVLFLAANPKDSTRLRLDEEIREIDKSLRGAEFRDKFELHQQWATRVTDLQGHLMRYKPDIVHFSGHGGDNQLILEDKNGKSIPVSTEALTKLFQLLGDNIKCVILNACYSYDQAVAISKHVNAVIGMSDAIGDRSSISFAAAFYEALAYGKDIKTSFELGCLRVDMEGLKENDIPRLLCKDDCDTISI